MPAPKNPYIAGSPITGREMFFGRDDIFAWVRENLTGEYQDHALVLYGHRRTGKTSVLYQMEHHLDPIYLPILIDLQGLSLKGGMGFLLHGIANYIRIGLRKSREIQVVVPPREDFVVDPAATFEDVFLPAVWEQMPPDTRLLLMFDEAMRLEDEVQAGRLEREVFDYLRSLMQHHHRLNFIYSLGSRVETAARDYAVLFSVALYRRVSFLDPDSACKLIVEPVRDCYRYDDDALALILAATSGQPYFTQLICHALFARWAKNGQQAVTPADVQAVLPEATEQGTAILKYIWDESTPAEQAILATLSELIIETGGTVTSRQLRPALQQAGMPLSGKSRESALKRLVDREVLAVDGDRYHFCVDLMRLWVAEHQRPDWVRGTLLPELELEAAGRLPALPRWAYGLGGLSLVVLTVLATIAAIVLAVLLWPRPPYVVGQTTVTPDQTEAWQATEDFMAAVRTAVVQTREVEAVQTLEAAALTRVAEYASRPTAMPTPTPTSTETPRPNIPTPTPSPTPWPTMTATPTVFRPFSLANYPQPARNTRRGVHGYPIVSATAATFSNVVIEDLRKMQIQWVTVLDDGTGVSLDGCRELLAVGITPVVRIHPWPPNPGTLDDAALAAIKSLVAAGVRYFVTNNEPNLPGEWQGNELPNDWLDVVVDNFITDADNIIALGGYPGFPAMFPTETFPSWVLSGSAVELDANPFELIAERGRSDLFEQGMWLAAHVWLLEDVYSQQSQYFSATIEQLDDWARQAAGHELPIIVTEGGPAGLSPADKLYAEEVLNLFGYLEMSGLETVFGFCVWHVGDWYRSLSPYDPYPVVDALKGF